MEEEDYSALGFMFDAQHTRIEKFISFEEHSIDVKLQLIGEDPGHVQSGQYLWPAAKAASLHLLKNWDNILSKLGMQASPSAAVSVIELGAGCGLTGIIASKLRRVDRILLTDYDRGSLQLLEVNAIRNCLTCPYEVQYLEWGSHIESSLSLFDLVVGSDLLYSIDIVEPLLNTVSQILHARGGLFILVSSFDIGRDIERRVEDVSLRFRLTSEEITSLDMDASPMKCRVQYFTVLPSSIPVTNY